MINKFNQPFPGLSLQKCKFVKGAACSFARPAKRLVLINGGMGEGVSQRWISSSMHRPISLPQCSRKRQPFWTTQARVRRQRRHQLLVQQLQTTRDTCRFVLKVRSRTCYAFVLQTPPGSWGYRSDAAHLSASLAVLMQFRLPYPALASFPVGEPGQLVIGQPQPEPQIFPGGKIRQRKG